MAYIESFFYYIAVTVVMFVVIFGFIIFAYWFLGQFKLFYSHDGRGNFNFEDQKNLLFSLVKHKLFKLVILFYFATALFFYINQSIHYYGKDRAYPQAKAYAIVANTIYFWQSNMVNIRISRGWGQFYRLLRPEDKLDVKVQAIQDFLLDKMYQYIPENDGERDIWHYKFKQSYVAKIRYKPDSIFQPHPRFSKIMDGMYKTSFNLDKKPIKDKVFNQQRYIPIAQMSVYLMRNIAYYATYEKSNYQEKMMRFMDDENKFHKLIDYSHLLKKIYKAIQNDQTITDTFDNNPYAKGFLFTALAYSYDYILTRNTHNGIYPCSTLEMKLYTQIIKDFYTWIFVTPNSSFYKQYIF